MSSFIADLYVSDILHYPYKSAKDDSSNGSISRRLISGVSFMSISSIMYEKWRGEGGGGRLTPPPLPQLRDAKKKPSLNRVNNVNGIDGCDYIIKTKKSKKISNKDRL